MLTSPSTVRMENCITYILYKPTTCVNARGYNEEAKEIHAQRKVSISRVEPRPRPPSMSSSSCVTFSAEVQQVSAISSLSSRPLFARHLNPVSTHHTRYMSRGQDKKLQTRTLPLPLDFPSCCASASASFSIIPSNVLHLRCNSCVDRLLKNQSKRNTGNSEMSRLIRSYTSSARIP